MDFVVHKGKLKITMNENSNIQSVSLKKWLQVKYNFSLSIWEPYKHNIVSCCLSCLFCG